MEGDRGRSTHFVSLRLRNFIIGSVQLMLGVCLLSFHVLNLIKIIEKRDLFDNLSTFLPDDEKSSHQTYHIASSVLASIMIVFTFILFWGIFDVASYHLSMEYFLITNGCVDETWNPAGLIMLKKLLPRKFRNNVEMVL
ncbi:uncharacterized protein [Halyomorpha halys]|uniref:uncharacterized protein isoform X4 n=1 Tax=Halyomorpha halys TaxID=286706 RepID=UPI0006D51F0F|nr:uncharacterized protein LOC106691170 isoform X4 [Halyomorpha halys]